MQDRQEPVRSKGIRSPRQTRQISGECSLRRTPQAGVAVIEIPFIEIRKPKSFKSLDVRSRISAAYDSPIPDQREWRSRPRWEICE